MDTVNRPAQPGAWVLGSETHRQFVGALIALAPKGWVARLDPPKRNLFQNALLHAALSDIAEQVTWHGKKFSVEVWKRLVTAAWLREQNEQPMLVPALDGNGFDMIFQKTSRLTVAQMSSLMDWVQAFGAQHNVVFREPKEAP